METDKVLGMVLMVGAIGVGGLVLQHVSRSPSFEARLVEACEGVIRERLLAASSYVREDVGEVERRAANWLDALGAEYPLRKLQIAERNTNAELKASFEEQIEQIDAYVEPMLYEVTITYRGVRNDGRDRSDRSVCTYFVKDAAPDPELREGSVRVDGFTESDWMFARMSPLLRGRLD